MMARFKRVVIPELNSGQLALLVRARYLIDAISYTKVQGLPFSSDEIMNKVDEVICAQESKG